MAEPLSPAAQAVLDAATSVCHPETEVVAFQCTRLEVAAALRAAAVYCTRERRILMTIAAELEGGND